MKITLDTTNKKIILGESINLSELFNELDSLGIDFNEYSIEGNTSYVTYTPWTSQPMSPFYTTDLSGTTHMLHNSTTTCKK